MGDIFTSFETWGYIALAFFSLGGSLVAVILAGFLSYLGKMDLEIAIMVGIVFNYIGDMILFYIGKYQIGLINPYLKNHKKKLAMSILLIRKYGNIVIFIQKFLYGLKTLVPLAMAISKYNFKKFGFYNIFASIIYVTVVMLISYNFGKDVEILIYYIIDNPWIPFVTLVSILILIITYIKIIKYKRIKRKEKNKKIILSKQGK